MPLFILVRVMIERGERKLYNTLSVCYPCYACGCMYHVSHLTDSNVVLSFLLCLNWGVQISERGAESVGVQRRHREAETETGRGRPHRPGQAEWMRPRPVRCGLERSLNGRGGEGEDKDWLVSGELASLPYPGRCDCQARIVLDANGVTAALGALEPRTGKPQQELTHSEIESYYINVYINRPILTIVRTFLPPPPPPPRDAGPRDPSETLPLDPRFRLGGCGPARSRPLSSRRGQIRMGRGGLS